MMQIKDSDWHVNRPPGPHWRRMHEKPFEAVEAALRGDDSLLKTEDDVINLIESFYAFSERSRLLPGDIEAMLLALDRVGAMSASLPMLRCLFPEQMRIRAGDTPYSEDELFQVAFRMERVDFCTPKVLLAWWKDLPEENIRALSARFAELGLARPLAKVPPALLTQKGLLLLAEKLPREMLPEHFRLMEHETFLQQIRELGHKGCEDRVFYQRMIAGKSVFQEEEGLAGEDLAQHRERKELACRAGLYQSEGMAGISEYRVEDQVRFLMRSLHWSTKSIMHENSLAMLHELGDVFRATVAIEEQFALMDDVMGYAKVTEEALRLLDPAVRLQFCLNHLDLDSAKTSFRVVEKKKAQTDGLQYRAEALAHVMPGLPTRILTPAINFLLKSGYAAPEDLLQYCRHAMTRKRLMDMTIGATP